MVKKVKPSLFEKAIGAAGQEFRADKLWEAYIEWEKSRGNLKHVTALYDRLLNVPTQQYSKHFEKFKEHINSNAPADVLDTEELLKLRAEVGAAPPGVDSDAAVINIAPDVAPPGIEDESEETEPGAPGEEAAVTVKKTDDVESTAIREKVIAARTIIFTANEDEVRKRWSFEEAIKRPYFHVKPLERVQLKNWREYLDFEIAQGDFKRIVVLFERCLIACALYEDFWQKFASFVEPNSIEHCRKVYNRACDIHLPRKVNIHLTWAAFEEQNGSASKASTILENIEKAVPGLTMLRIKRINLERRCGNNDKVMELYEESIQQSESEEIVSFFAIKYSRFLTRVMKDLTGARKTLKDALEKDKSNKRLYLQLLDLELHNNEPVDEEKVEEVFNFVKDSEDLSSDIKQGFSQRRLEFLEDYSISVDKIMKAYESHQKLFKVKPAVAVAGKKRGSESETDGKSKSLKTDESQGASQTATSTDATHQDTSAYDAYAASQYAGYNYATPSAQNQWAGYSQQPGYNNYNAWYQQHYGTAYGQTTQ